MKNEMKCFKSREISRTNLFCLSTFLILTLSGCSSSDGGIIGTSTGPSTELYELENLPDRISPDIPKTLLKGDEITPSQTGDNKDAEVSFRNHGNSEEESEGWLELNLELNLVAFMRLVVENNATIVDLAFEDILQECAQQPVDCTIPSDRIRVTLTQDVVNRLIKLHTVWAESVSPLFTVGEEGADLNEMIITKFSSLVNKEVVLGETIYSRLDGAPYDHSIRTTLKRGAQQSDDLSFPHWKDEEFFARWHEDGGVAKFITKSETWPNQEFFYQNNTPSEMVVAKYMFADAEGTQDALYAKVIGTNPNESGILLELASMSKVVGSSSSGTGSTGSSTSSDSVDDFDEPTTESSSTLGYHYGVFQARMDNDGGYSSRDERDYDSTGGQDLNFYFGYRESFDRVGKLLAGERCFSDFDSFIVGNCDDGDFQVYGPEGGVLTDSPYYFKAGEFDSLAAVQDAIRWEVVGLETDVKGIVVVTADSTLDMSKREPYCRGIQLSPADMRLFCSATDEQLDNVVVLELINGRIGALIPAAKLVQIQ